MKIIKADDKKTKLKGRNPFILISTNAIVALLIMSCGFVYMLFYTNSIFAVDEENLQSPEPIRIASSYEVVDSTQAFQSNGKVIPGVTATTNGQPNTPVTPANGKVIDTSGWYAAAGSNQNSFAVMAWSLISSTSADVYKLRKKYYPNWDNSMPAGGRARYQQGDPNAYDPNDHIGRIEGRYTIACTVESDHGLAAECAGQCIDVYLDDGTLIPCVVADTKSSGDASWTKYGHVDGGLCIIEFVVDGTYYYDNAKNNSGRMHTSATWKHPEWAGRKVAKIVRGDILKY